MLQKSYEFFTKRVEINGELTLTDWGIQQILILLGSNVLPAAEGAAPKQFYDTRILERLGR